MMNYLAHAYLSFHHPRVLVGNMISDFVKGKAVFTYERQIQAGIRLHRQIDHFTDHHDATRRAMEIFRPAYRLYSGAFIDIVYDHFLANDHNQFPADALHPFTVSVYAILNEHAPELPERFLQVLPHMQAHNWLYHYKEKEGIARSFRGLVHRAAYMSDSNTAYKLFLEHYDTLGECYDAFFEDVKKYAKGEWAQLLA
jgi:acyl carrier protein phosphodiesterase